MQELTNLVNLIKKRRHRVIEVFNEVDDPSKQTILNKFYAGIRYQKYNTDSDAAQDLYSVDEYEKKYQMLKGRLRSRLLDSLIFLNINQPKYTAYQEAYFEANKSMFFIKTLLEGNVFETAIKLLDHLLEDAKKYCFTNLVLESAQMLMGLAYQHKTKYSFDKYAKIVKKYNELNFAEVESRHFYTQLEKHISRAASYRKDYFSKVEEELSAIKERADKLDYYNTTVAYHRCRVAFHYMKKEYDKVIEHCDAIQSLYAKNEFIENNDTLKHFSIMKIKSYIKLRDFDKGILESNKMFKFYNKGTLEWFEFMDFHILLLFHSERFDEAEEHFIKVIKEPKYNDMPEHIRNRYNIYAGYLYFAATTEWLVSKKCTNRPFQKRHGLLDLMETIPEFSKDTLDYNVSAVILRVLILFAHNDFEGIYNTLDAMHFYARKHLKRYGHERSNIFIHMLIKLVQHNFDYIRVRNSAEKMFMELAPFSEEDTSYLDNLEVMPYDKLWNYLLTQLDSRPKRKAILKLHY